VVEVLGMFIFRSFQLKDSQTSTKKQHFEDLYNIYKRISRVRVRTYGKNRENVTLTFPREIYVKPKTVSLSDKVREMMDDHMRIHPLDNTFELSEMSLYSDYEYFDFAIEHLKHKKYENIYKHWNKINELIIEFNEKDEKSLDKLQAEIKQFTNTLEEIITKLKSGKTIRGKCLKCS